MAKVLTQAQAKSMGLPGRKSLEIVSGEKGAQAVKEMNGGDRVHFVQGDIKSREGCQAIIDAAIAKYGKIDIMVNNAGVSGGSGNIETTTVENWQRVQAINSEGVFLGCKYAIPTMLEQGKGSIINVASFVAHMGAATPQVAYTASKGAVLAMTREIAVIYARKGIRANALCPGPVMTPLLAAFLSDDAKRNRRLVHIPMGRFGEPTEIAHGALFLASDESSWMTGQSLIIDGGITAAYVTPE